MKHDEFKEVLEARIERMRAVLDRKAAEYSRHGDRLSNFKDAGRAQDIGPEQACWNFTMKHLISIQDMVRDASHGVVFPLEKWDEKLGDAINYLVLLDALVVESSHARLGRSE